MGIITWDYPTLITGEERGGRSHLYTSSTGNLHNNLPFDLTSQESAGIITGNIHRRVQVLLQVIYIGEYRYYYR